MEGRDEYLAQQSVAINSERKPKKHRKGPKKTEKDHNDTEKNTCTNLIPVL